jgi:hypothetical protein
MSKIAKSITLLLIVLLLVTVPVMAKKKKQDAEPEAPEGPFNAGTFAGLALRNIGPATTSGRISDFAVDPRIRKRYFVAVGSGGVWGT